MSIGPRMCWNGLPCMGCCSPLECRRTDTGDAPPTGASIKDKAAALIGARSAKLNAQADLNRTIGAYKAAEAEYLKAIGDHLHTRVFQNVAISTSSMFPDSRDGEHLEFDTVEVVA